MSNSFHLNHYPIEIGESPKGWCAAAINQFCEEPQPGFACGIHNADGRGIVHLRPMNIDSEGAVKLDDVKFVSGDKPLRVRDGDVLFNNTNSPAWVGKSAAIQYSADWAFSNHMTRLRPLDGDPDILAQEIVDDLEDALEQFTSIAGALKVKALG